jgi:RHS repeat-associated protein
LNDGTRIYTWDARNRLVAISGASTASFQYDAFGRRIQKTVNGTTTKYLYDGINPAQEITGTAPTANLLTGLNVDEIFRRTDSQGPRDFVTDALGSTLALTDSAGTIQTRYTYDPYGNTTTTGQGSTNPFQYTGRENDGTGLYFYRARYYSAQYQRFISQDPVGFAGGDVNLTRYVYNNPMLYTDPEGNIAYAAVTGLIGFVAGGASAALSGGSPGTILTSALIGGLAGAVNPLSLLGQAGLGAASSALSQVAASAIDGKCFNLAEVAAGAIPFGALAGPSAGLVRGLGKLGVSSFSVRANALDIVGASIAGANSALAGAAAGGLSNSKCGCKQ